MKILVVGTKWWGDWIDSLSDAFKRLGHISFIFYLKKQKNNLKRFFLPYKKYKQSLNCLNKKEFLNLIKQEKSIDLVIVFNQDFINDEIKQVLDDKNIKVFLWLGDDPFTVGDVVNKLDFYNQVFSWDPYYVDILQIISNKKIHYLPAAADDKTYFPIKDLKKDIDISFVGSLFGVNKIIRAKTFINLFESIKDKLPNIKIAIYGNNQWQKAFEAYPFLQEAFQKKVISTKDTNIIYNRSKIVLNLHHPQNIYATNLRTFEIALTGVYQIANDKIEIKNIFGNKLKVFRDINALTDLIINYLNNPKAEAENIKAIQTITLNNHTYLKRADTIINLFKQIK